MKRRLSLLAAVGLGVLLWRGGFGFLSIEYTLTWHLPVPYSQLKKLELQVWDEHVLLHRQQRLTPSGLTEEPTSKVLLSRGLHRAVALAWLGNAKAPLTFQLEFNATAKANVTLEF